MKRAIFLDRDGVINKVILRDDKPCSPRSIEEFEFEEGIERFVSEVKERGYLTIVVTNQPDVARNHLTSETLGEMYELIKGKMAIDDLLVCTHDDADNCDCRKPKPGMILDSVKKWDIDISHSFFVCDGLKDVGAGRAAGCRTILIDRSYNRSTDSDFRASDFEEALKIIDEN